ncbi:MAG: bifunctional phosphopantothenoylcysteine decarboxylase/phosphopantothenate--cysteine ligase CoaBC [Kiritimatiellae bacterium]|nr:bifunctional phosphopantothenoylcysteine decarboxylase/phosphopantothenate--cysteine ligase CoaBC [Kiritimatiellia bacterium]
MKSSGHAVHVLIGVTGGIAAYKTPEVVRALLRAGVEVTVAMTPAATRFVSPLTFAALTGRRVRLELLPDGTTADGADLYPHLEPATRTHVFLVCPASANAIARLAAGFADDAVTAAALALPAGCRRWFAPAMHPAMWANPLVQANVRKLEAEGWRRIGPGTGPMACGAEGEGRMAEPNDIVAAVLEETRDLAGRRILVLSGPTREPVDAVRFLSNASSGRMGREIALAAASRGAAVVFISGPVESAMLPQHPSVEVRRVQTAREMLAAALAAPPTDAVIFAAAVADAAPARPARGKLPRERLGRAITLVRTPDIAASLPRRPGQYRVGFALETRPDRRRAERKLHTKHFDLIVLNGPESIGADVARFACAEAGPPVRWTEWGQLDKRECARRIVEWLARRLGEGPTATELQ